MWRWRSSFYLAPEDGGAGGGGSEIQNEQGTGTAGGGGTRTQDSIANLRAELAAERVAKRDLDSKVLSLQTSLETERGAVAQKLADEVKAAVEPITVKFTKLQSKLVDAEMRSMGAELGLADPDLLMHPLLDRTKVQVDEEGNVTGVKEAFEDLKTKKPDWFKAVGTPATPGTGTSTTTGRATPPAQGTGATGLKNVKEMTKQEYKEWQAAEFRKLRSAS